MQNIAVIDYGIGNVFSVCNALDAVGFQPVLTRDPKLLLKADKIVLPGVGAFGRAKLALDALELPEVINELIQSGKPFLGICVGMQLLFDASEEFGHTNGLGYIPGLVKRIPDIDADGIMLRIPHVSWAKLKKPPGQEVWGSPVLQTTDGSEEAVYFVHSFHGVCLQTDHLLAQVNYGGIQITAAVGYENILGFQFHPERSGIVGQNILKRFGAL